MSRDVAPNLGDGVVLKDLKSVAGELFWESAVAPLLDPLTVYYQSTDKSGSLSQVRARASKATNQLRFHFLRIYSELASPAMYLDTDAILSPQFVQNYKAFRADTAYSRRRECGFLLSTYGRGSGVYQSSHFTKDFRYGPYSQKELVVNSSVLLFDPVYYCDADRVALNAAASAYATETAAARKGRKIEWSAAAKECAAVLEELPSPASLAPPFLLHPLSTKEKSNDPIPAISRSMVVSLSGNLDERYADLILNHYAQAGSARARSRTPRRDETQRVTLASCPSKLKDVFSKVTQKQVRLLDAEAVALDMRTATKEAGSRSGLKEMSVSGLKLLSARLKQQQDKHGPRK